MSKKMEEMTKGMSGKRKDAFMLYCKLREAGITKPFQKIAAEVGNKEGTIYNWSWEYKWKELYKEIELEATEEAMEQLKSGIITREIKNKEFFLKTLDKMENHILDNIEDFVSDYSGFFKLFQLALGEATDRVESNHGFSQEGLDTLREYIKKAESEDDDIGDEFLKKLK